MLVCCVGAVEEFDAFCTLPIVATDVALIVCSNKNSLLIAKLHAIRQSYFEVVDGGGGPKEACRQQPNMNADGRI
jgi:hypothetical protein